MRVLKQTRGCMSIILAMALLISIVGNDMTYAEAGGQIAADTSVSRVVEDFEGKDFSVSFIRAKGTLSTVNQSDFVQSGKQAAKLEYDFTNQESGTTAAYINILDPGTTQYRELEGKPTKLGMWVYGDGNNKHWLRAEFNTPSDVADFTTASGFNWTGWKYVTVSIPERLTKNSFKEPIKLRRIYIAQTNEANRTAGTVYLDKISVYYDDAEKLAPVSPKRELRAAWISTVNQIDWPKTNDPAKQRQDYKTILDLHQSTGMNAVIMQIRPTADAFYPSKLAPWSHWITGVQGKDPGYDPLAFMIEEAHKRNLEFHAWFNPYRISMNTDLSKLAANHPARLHPEWVMEYQGKLYFNPGIPEVMDYITDSVMEVVKNYDIDAVHFDDYFYPNRFDGEGYPDQAAYKKYGADFKGGINAWRRHNVDTLIEKLSVAIKKEKSYVKFGISPFGVWRNKADDPLGSNTKAGQPSYDNLHADIRKWVLEGWIDYVAPQIYWNFGFTPAPYEVLVKWWDDLIRNNKTNTQLYIGHADYKVDENENFKDPHEIRKQLLFNRDYNQVKGSIHFTTRDLMNKPKLRADIAEVYRYPALVPAMPWLDAKAPQKLTNVSAVVGADGIQVKWSDSDTSTAYYVVYRAEADKAINKDDPTQIAAIVRKHDNQSTYIDSVIKQGKQYSYAITAVDRLHNESELSSPISAGTGEVEVPKPEVPKPEVPEVPEPEAPKPGEPKPEVPGCTVMAVTDIGGHWAEASIKLAMKQCLVSGYPNQTFQPNRTISREEFAVMLVKALKLEQSSEGTLSAFADEKQISVWARTAVAAAVKANIISGYQDKSFRPKANINRTEMAVMLARALALPLEVNAKTTFADDADIPSWAKSYVKEAAQEGIVAGNNGNLFAPMRQAVRAEAVVMLLRAVDYLNEEIAI